MTEEPPDITDVKDQQPAIEKAFTGLHEFNGFALEPYSPARIMAAQAMGLHYGSIDEAGRSRFVTDKIYPGAQSDMAIVLWLCSLKTQAEVDAARRAPIPAMDRVYAFAEEHQLTDTGDENFWKGFMVFLDIMNEVAASRVKAEKKIIPDNPQVNRSDLIYPSEWAAYLTSVASVTNETVTFIEYHMSYARGLQYPNGMVIPTGVRMQVAERAGQDR